MMAPVPPFADAPEPPTPILPPLAPSSLRASSPLPPPAPGLHDKTQKGTENRPITTAYLENCIAIAPRRGPLHQKRERRRSFMPRAARPIISHDVVQPLTSTHDEL